MTDKHDIYETTKPTPPEKYRVARCCKTCEHYSKYVVCKLYSIVTYPHFICIDFEEGTEWVFK